MSYQRIQKILEASGFASKVVSNDTEVVLRNGEKAIFPATVVNVYNILKTAGCNVQSVSRTIVLAAATQLENGSQVPSPAPVPSPGPEQEASKPKKKEAATAPTQPKSEFKPQQSTSKQVVVTATRAGSPKPTLPLDKQVDIEVLHRYQCAIASAQLLAALHQLFEKDDYPGHEVRKKKLDELINEVEHMSSAHVNLSVKAIIRAKSPNSK